MTPRRQQPWPEALCVWVVCLFLRKPYLKIALREFVQIWYKCPLWPADKLISIWWSKVKATVTSWCPILGSATSQECIEVILSNVVQVSTMTQGWAGWVVVAKGQRSRSLRPHDIPFSRTPHLRNAVMEIIYIWCNSQQSDVSQVTMTSQTHF